MKSIYVMGECAMDFVKNEAAEDSGYRRSPGGCAVNVCAELARLAKARGEEGGCGITPCIVGRVGGDAYGREIAETLKAGGVNTLYLKTAAAPTSEVYMDICANGHRRCAGRKNGADTGLCAGDVKGIVMRGGDAFCFTSSGFLTENGKNAHMLMLQKAEDAGALVCLDLNIREGLWKREKPEELLLPVIERADVIKINGRELEMLFGEDSMEPLFKTAKGKFFAVYTDGAGERRYRRGCRGGEIAAETRFSERRCRGIGAGDKLFAGIVLEAVEAAKIL